MHYLAAELESRATHAGQVDLERDQRHTQADPVQPGPAGLFPSMLQALHQVGVKLSRCDSEHRLLHDAVALARQSCSSIASPSS